MSLIDEYNRLISAKNNLYNSVVNRNIDISTGLNFNGYIEKINSIGNKELDEDFIISIRDNNQLVRSTYCPSGDASSSLSFYKKNTDNIIIGNKITNLSKTFNGSSIKTAACGDSITDMYMTYYNCINLISPVCGPNVTNMSYTYAECINLTGDPVCDTNVTDMSFTYYNCQNITGSPICGPNVTNMISTYFNCTNITGNPVCGDNVTTMSGTYRRCTNLTGSPVCGPNVTGMYSTYSGCVNVSGNAYLYSPSVSNVQLCFNGIGHRLNIYVPAGSTTLQSCLTSNYRSFIGSSLSWTNDVTNNGCFYNTSYNFYIYPVDNIAQARLNNND